MVPLYPKDVCVSWKAAHTDKPCMGFNTEQETGALKRPLVIDRNTGQLPSDGHKGNL